MIATCDETTCGIGPAAPSTHCMDGGGKVCDGAGQCVACVTTAECGPAISNACKGGVHTEPTTCNGNVCMLGKVDDCAAMEQICKPDGCAPCVGNLDCGPPEAACVDRQCIAGLCKKVSLSQGSACLPPVIGTCDATDTCVSPRKYVFITAKPFLANFVGTAGADATCTTVAGLAGLGGTWMSWTSDTASSPSTRFTQSSAPYMLLDDMNKVANDWAGLISGKLLHPISLDEKQQLVVSPPEVWTGTDSSGVYTGSACTNWTFANPANGMATAGMVDGADSAWTNAKPLGCSSKAHLYCFQQ